MNPMQFFNMMSNPQQGIQMMIQQNPQFAQVYQMAQGKSPAELEQLAHNICQQRGIDYNAAMQAFNNFRGMIPK